MIGIYKAYARVFHGDLCICFVFNSEDKMYKNTLLLSSFEEKICVKYMINRKVKVNLIFLDMREWNNQNY